MAAMCSKDSAFFFLYVFSISVKTDMIFPPKYLENVNLKYITLCLYIPDINMHAQPLSYWKVSLRQTG